MDRVESHRQQWPHLLLPVAPADEEVARNRTLSETDRVEVRRCRGGGNRLPFPVQRCALQTYGRFVNNFIMVPVRTANSLCRQLGLSPVLFVQPPGREASFVCNALARGWLLHPHRSRAAREDILNLVEIGE